MIFVEKNFQDQLQKINPMHRDSDESKTASSKPLTNAKPKVKKAVDKITLNDEVVEVCFLIEEILIKNLWILKLKTSF